MGEAFDMCVFRPHTRSGTCSTTHYSSASDSLSHAPLARHSWCHEILPRFSAHLTSKPSTTPAIQLHTMVSPTPPHPSKEPLLIPLICTGRQTPHPAAARGSPKQIHRDRPRRHHQARVDHQYRPRLLRLLPGPPASAALHEHRHGAGDGADEDEVYGGDGVAVWASAGYGGVRAGRRVSNRWRSPWPERRIDGEA